MTETKKIMLTLKEAACETGISYNSLRLLCLAGKIPHVRIGTKFFIPRSELLKFLGVSSE